jgi:galactokinase
VRGQRRYYAPGRVNLIGEHTDYAGGLVLPCAIDRGITLCATPAAQISLTSDRGGTPVVLTADGHGEADGWGRYAAAVAQELALAGRPPVGLRGWLSSDLPDGIGLSSSAALEVCLALALCDVAELTLPAIDLALLCQRAEWRAVGVPCGVMDQAAIVLGRPRRALFLDCASLAYEHVELPGELSIAIIDSGERRELASSGYADRRREVERGLAGNLDDTTSRRLRHVESESHRVLETVAALRAGRQDRLGDLFLQSHRSLRDDFDVTTQRLDLLVALSYESGAVAARMTGGGFGGAIVALVPNGDARRFVARVLRQFADRSGDSNLLRWDVVQAGDGACRLS